MLKVAKKFEESEQSLLPPSKEVNADDIADKSLSRAFVQPVTESKATTDLKTKKKKIPPSSKPKSPYKVRVILPNKQVTKTQHAEVTVATADATKSLKASELAKEQGNQPSTVEAKKVLDQNVEKDDEFMAMEEVAEEQSLEIPTVEQLLDEANKLNKAVQETLESPYDTESEIKVVKSFFTSHISELKDQTMHDSEEIADFHEGSDSDLQSMTDDDLRSVSGFYTIDSKENAVSKSDNIFKDDHASAEHLSLSDHMDHICEEVISLYSRLGDMESSIELPHVEAQVQKNLQAQLPTLHLKPMYKEINAFNKLESQRFVILQKELNTMATNSQHVQDLRVMFHDIVSLLEVVEIFKKANDEGEKWEKNNTAKEKDAQHPDQIKGEQISRINSADNVQGEQPLARGILNDEKALVVHNLEEKKEGTVSIDDDDLDKQPL
ncbi:hypothetical protein Tco_0647728 [Tanacetum coccineum]